MSINELVNTNYVFINAEKNEDLPSLDVTGRSITISFADDYKISSHTLSTIVNYLRKGNDVSVYTDSRETQRILEQTKIYRILKNYGNLKDSDERKLNPEYSFNYAVNF